MNAVAHEEPLETAEVLLRYWFGTETDAARICSDRAELWWGAKGDIDADVRNRFGALRDEAARGRLDHWAREARGRLALIILLDQVSRNIHRGTAEAFAADGKALDFALSGIEAKDDAALRPVERVFLYMPLVHAEQIAIQDRAVALFDELVRGAPAEHVAAFGAFRRHAEAHRDVIRRFGRFPHRNVALERTSTAEEMEFLSQPRPFG